MSTTHIDTRPTRRLPDVIKEVSAAVERARSKGVSVDVTVKDFRWQFDQVSAKMNQAVYNNDADAIHNACLETVAVLIEMLSRS